MEKKELTIEMNLASTKINHNGGGIEYDFNNSINGSFPAELKIIDIDKKLEPGYYKLTIEKIG